MSLTASNDNTPGRDSAAKHLAGYPIAPASGYDNLSLGDPVTDSEKISTRSKDEIDRLLQMQGFPEINRLWEHFKKSKTDLSLISETELFRKRQLHCSPLGKHPLINTAIIACGSAFLALSYSTLLSQGSQHLTAAIAAVNIVFLALISMTSVRRRKLFNMEDRMAEETAYLLSKPNFRTYFEKLGRTKEADSKLSQLGFTSLWDNPQWEILYSRGSESIDSSKWSASEISFNCVKNILGRKENRNFIQGQFFGDLKEGKRSINAILSRFAGPIKSIKDGTASTESCISFLHELDSLFLKEDSAGSRHVHTTIKKINGDLEHAEWKAEIWKRNPIKDLTHQEEFYSSASLRGVKAIGRGVKGRLGTFLYHWNRSITMLDIRSAKGRVIRARLIAVTARSADGNVHPAILVDGVEGTTAVPHDVIQKAIEDYGKACGAKMVLYNGFAYNQVPKLFSRFIGKKSNGLVKVNISIVDNAERQYLDSFGIPLEPFEYAFAKGSVCVYTRNLSADSFEFSPASSQDRFFQALRRGILTLITTQTIVTSTVATFPQSTTGAVLILAFGVSGLAVNHLFQRRSLKKAVK